MVQPRIRLVVLLIILTLLTTNLFADNGQHMVPISLQERTRQADMVIEGEVLSQKSFWNVDRTNIYTSHIIRVYKVFKGSVQEKQLELITQGGSVGLKKHILSTALELYKGQQGVFFLMQEKEIQTTPANLALRTRAYASQQGFVKYNLQENSAADVFNSYTSVQRLYDAVLQHTGNAYRTLQENEPLLKAIDTKNSKSQTQNTQLVPVITNFIPTIATAGTGAILTINGTNFGNTRGTGKVEFRNADDGGKTFVEPRRTDYVSWTNTQIRVRIPSRGVSGGTAGSGEVRVTAPDGSVISSANPITIEFAHLNVVLSGDNIQSFKPLLQNKNGRGGYTVRFAPSLQNRSDAQEGFVRALNSWTCATNVNWEVGAPTTIEAANDDNTSVIRFAGNSTFGQEGVLASTLSRWEGLRCGTDTLFWLSEFDMAINSSISWQYGPGPPVNRQFDFETVMLHELGHAHQLGHVILPRAVMHFAVESQVLIRDLSDADIRGGNQVMEQSVVPNVCQEPPMERKTDGDCNLAQEVLTFEGSFQDGQVVLNWQTQQEQNVNFYTVQRSTNGTDWTDLTDVDATGASKYTYTDNNPLSDISFYRLKVVYNDNSSSFSARVRVIDPRSLRVLRVYPNPIPPDVYSVNLLYLVQASTTLSVQLYSINGKLVRDIEYTLSDVNVPIELSLGDLAAGIYILKWRERTNNGEFKIVKL